MCSAYSLFDVYYYMYLGLLVMTIVLFGVFDVCE